MLTELARVEFGSSFGLGVEKTSSSSWSFTTSVVGGPMQSLSSILVNIALICVFRRISWLSFSLLFPSQSSGLESSRVRFSDLSLRLVVDRETGVAPMDEPKKLDSKVCGILRQTGARQSLKWRTVAFKSRYK